MKTTRIATGLAATAVAVAATQGAVQLSSPGFEPSAMDADGRLVEDWGRVGVRLDGAGVADAAPVVEPVKLDGVIPAARAVRRHGAVKLTTTAFRAPAHPSGLDVLLVRVEETRGAAARVTVALDVPTGARAGMRTVRLGNRNIITLPSPERAGQQRRAWGHSDDGLSLAGWAKPAVPCDPAFRNIRAGMGGVPLRYHFTVRQRAVVHVALGFCESHWAERGQRVLLCRVEGALPQELDPVVRWGRHKPGVLLFAAKDENQDGWLDISVHAAPTAKDKNPILNALWIFPANEPPNPAQIIAGELNARAIRYVDCGGPADQSLYAGGQLEYPLALPAGGAQELMFIVACNGGAAPSPDASAWTAETLRRAAREVWRDWR